MPKITDPMPNLSIRNNTLKWDMEGVSYFSSEVFVGSIPGSDNLYIGKEFMKDTNEDRAVRLPPGKICFARVRYRKAEKSPWYCADSKITRFRSS